MQIQSWFQSNPMAMVSNFIGKIGKAQPQKNVEIQVAAKEEIPQVVVMSVTTPQLQKSGMWETAEKVGSVIRQIAEPVARKVIKGTVDIVLDRLELKALEKVASTLGDTVLPGEVAAVPALIKVIRAGVMVLKVANQSNQGILPA